MRKPLTIKRSTLFAAIFLILVCAHRAKAAATSLPFRYEPNGVYIHNGVTSQTIETSFGTNLVSLAFTNTTTYDFYSPPLSTNASLVPSDKGGGVIYMRNTGSAGSNDFSVSGRMQYFDYNPVTGTETLVVDTTASSAKNVNHGQTVNWAIPNALLPAPTLIPAGHMIHVAMTIGLISGNPGSFGQVLYNGPNNSSTTALFPQNTSIVFDWPLSSGLPAQPQILSFQVAVGPTALMDCSGSPGGTYLIQATTNLAAAWITLSTNVAGTNGLFQFTDSDAPNYSCRFYRLSTP
jgi:hypothetical protein